MNTDSKSLLRISRLRAGWACSLLLLAVSVLLYYLLPWSQFARQGIVLAGIAIYAVATMLVVFAKCPQCGHLFHNVLGFNNPLSRSCSHCGHSLEQK